MTISAFNVFDKACLTACILAAIYFTSYCLYQYNLDEDTSLVHFRKYHNARYDIYPAVSLCFADYLIKSVFRNNKKEMERYKNSFFGKEWNDKFSKLKYEDVTFDIRNYLIETFMTKYDDEVTVNDEDDGVYQDNTGDIKGDTNENDIGMDDDFDEEKISWNMEKYLYLAANVNPYFKCWTFEIPFLEDHTNVKTFSIRLKRSVFEKSQRPRKEKFKIVISYPGQFLSAKVMRSDWKANPGLQNIDARMEFYIQNMVVLKKRNKWQEKCKTDSKQDDENKLKHIVQSIGCKPAYFSLNTTFPNCMNDGKEVNVSLPNIEYYDKPCRQVEKILYFYDEYAEPVSKSSVTRNETSYEILLNFQGTTYMEIEQSRAYDFNNLIGNGGGYVGVFLGVAIIQLPTFLFKIHSFIGEMLY